MNFFNQGLSLGRWFGIRVILHWTFFLGALYFIFSAQDKQASTIETVLLFAVVLAHEFGHALSCKALGGQAPLIILWPLGGIAFVQPPPKAYAWLISTICGPLVNAILWPVFWYLTVYGIPAIVTAWHIPLIIAQNLVFMSYILWMINKFLLLFNLIPAYPMDGGRIVQELLWMVIGFRPSLIFAGALGVVFGAAFALIGLGLFEITLPVLGFTLGQTGQMDPLLFIIGALVAWYSFRTYQMAMRLGPRTTHEMPPT